MFSSTSGRSIAGFRMLPASPSGTGHDHDLVPFGDVRGHRGRALARLVVGVCVHCHQTQLLGHDLRGPSCASPQLRATRCGSQRTEPSVGPIVPAGPRSARRPRSDAQPRRTLPEGRTAREPRRPLPKLARWALLAVAVAVGVRWSPASGTETSAPQPIEAQSRRASSILDDNAMEITFEVSRDQPERAAVCIVRARSEDGDESGRKEVLVPPGKTVVVETTVIRSVEAAGHRRSVRVLLPGTRLPVHELAAKRVNCGLNGDDREQIAVAETLSPCYYCSSARPRRGPCFSVPGAAARELSATIHVGPEQDEELVTVSDTQVTWLTQEAYDRLKAELDELIANRPVIAARSTPVAKRATSARTVATTRRARSRASRRRASASCRSCSRPPRSARPPPPRVSRHRARCSRSVTTATTRPRSSCWPLARRAPHGEMEVYSPASPLGKALQRREGRRDRLLRAAQRQAPEGHADLRCPLRGHRRTTTCSERRGGHLRGGRLLFTPVPEGAARVEAPASTGRSTSTAARTCGTSTTWSTTRCRSAFDRATILHEQVALAGRRVHLAHLV